MFGFVEGGFDVQDQVAAVAFTFAGDELDVFGVDADSGEAGFHFCGSACPKKVGKQNETFSVGGRQYRKIFYADEKLYREEPYM